MNALVFAALAAIAAPEQPVAIVGGKIFTVSGAVIPVGNVIVRGEKIAAVGADVPVPAGAKVIEAKGRWVTPGLIAANTQVGLTEVALVDATVDSRISWPDPVRAAVRMDDAIDQRSAVISVARRHGVTSAIAAPFGGIVSGRSAWVELVDPRSRLWKTSVSGPVAMHGMLGEAGAAAVGASRAMAAMRLREVLDDARLFKRSKPAFEKRALREMATSRLDLDALDDVISGRLPFVIGVHRASDILAVVRLARAEKLRVVVAGAEEAWIVADELAQAQVPVVVDPLDNLPSSFESRGARSDNAALLAKAGVKLVIASGGETGGSHNIGNLRFVLGNAVRAGLSFEAALRSATLTPAEVFGAARTHGSIETGKTADLVVWTGDPFEPSSYAEAVLIRGEAQPLDNRQTHLRDKYMALQAKRAASGASEGGQDGLAPPVTR